MFVRPQVQEQTFKLFYTPDEERKFLGLLRICDHAANKAGDFEVAHTWFDCAYALCGTPCDLLSAANMRFKLIPARAQQSRR